MYQIKELAKLILSLAMTKEKPINNLHLQLILYHLFVWHYKETGTLLFEDEFTTGVFGFKNLDIYFTYCGYGGRPITATYDDVKVNYSGSLFKEILRLIDVPVIDLSHEATESPCWNKYKRMSGTSKKVKEMTVPMMDMICLNCI